MERGGIRSLIGRYLYMEQNGKEKGGRHSMYGNGWMEDWKKIEKKRKEAIDRLMYMKQNGTKKESRSGRHGNGGKRE